eukprot:9733633-Alexandrium_andersonii.AAC.1
MGASLLAEPRRSSSCAVGGEPSSSKEAGAPLPSACASMPPVVQQRLSPLTAGELRRTFAAS